VGLISRADAFCNQRRGLCRLQRQGSAYRFHCSRVRFFARRYRGFLVGILVQATVVRLWSFAGRRESFYVLPDAMPMN
jgi:hypothetical protein